MTRPYLRPTLLQQRILVLVVETGSQAEAARRLGMTTGAVAGQMKRMRQRTGFRSMEQVVYAGARDGWLVAHEMRTQMTPISSAGVATSA